MPHEEIVAQIIAQLGATIAQLSTLLGELRHNPIPHLQNVVGGLFSNHNDTFLTDAR